MSSTPQSQAKISPNNHLQGMNASPSMQNIPSLNATQNQQTNYGGYQPRFIKKKPQNIASIDSSKELPVNLSGIDHSDKSEQNSHRNNNSTVTTQNVFYAPLISNNDRTSHFQETSVDDSNRSRSNKKVVDNIDEDERLINQMMEDLKRQKLQQQQQIQMQLQQNQAQNLSKNNNEAKGIYGGFYTQSTNNNQFDKNNQMSVGNQLQNDYFNSQSSNQVYQDSSGYVSLQQRSDIINITHQSPKRSNYSQNLNENTQLLFKVNKERFGPQNGDYDEIKRRKLDELKKAVMQENNQQFNTIQLITQDQSKSPIRQQQKSSNNMLNNHNLSQYQSSPAKSNNTKQSITPKQSQRPKDKTPTRENSQQQSQNQKNQRQFPRYNPILEGKQNPYSRQQNNQASNNIAAHFETVQYQPKQNNQKNDLLFKTQSDINNLTERQPRDISASNRNQAINKQNNGQNSQQKLRTTTPQPQRDHQKSQQNMKTIQNGSSKNQQNQQKQQDQSQQLLSEKSQQIYFQKLQKEVEIAIREADQDEKGGIDIEEFKQCLYNLNYLPYLNPANNHMHQLQANQSQTSRANDHTYQSTLRGLIIQEKEFVYNMWQVLNPTNQPGIDNAMVYDILLLLIYNVKSTIPTTAGFLSEYLENHYSEEGIQIEQLVANIEREINNGHSLNMGSFDINRDQEDNQSLLNRYLTYNNLWSVEKLAMEFKQIHANKVSYTQTLRMRSPSPIGSSKQIGLIDPMVTNKKFKPQVLNDHLSELTFSPNLSNQTKKLDSQLTSRLLQDGQLNQNLKRDTSADHILKNPQATITNKLTQQQTVKEQSNPGQQPLNRYELLFYRHHLAEQKIEKAKENLINKELEECSFQPNVGKTANTSMIGYSSQNNLNSLHSKTYQNLKREANQIFQDLSQKIKNQKQKYEEKNTKEEKELEECTFKPNILTTNTHKKAQKTPPPDKLPKGYQEQISRMRKINEEKKALEEKQKKKETGENYEKLKQLPIKPPSFIEKQREKRRLIMYVDVNITPTKAGRIGIYEGDNIKELAKNFQRTFQLSNNMLVLLQQQLEQHLINYKERHGIIDDNKTFFPKIQNTETKQQKNQKQQRDGNNKSELGLIENDFKFNDRDISMNNDDLQEILRKKDIDRQNVYSQKEKQVYNQNTFSNDIALDQDEEGVNVNLDELDEAQETQKFYQNQNLQLYTIKSPQQNDNSLQENEDNQLLDMDENDRLNEYVRQEIERYDRLARESQQQQMLNGYKFNNQNDFQLPGFAGSMDKSQDQQNYYENYQDSFNQM